MTTVDSPSVSVGARDEPPFLDWGEVEVDGGWVMVCPRAESVIGTHQAQVRPRRGLDCLPPTWMGSSRRAGHLQTWKGESEPQGPAEEMAT